MTKDDIRTVSKALGLSTWDKPSMACLATRVPYGQPLTAEAWRGSNRPRRPCARWASPPAACATTSPWPGSSCRADQLDEALRMRQTIVERIKAAGYTFVALDLEGFRSGSMNEALPRGPKEFLAAGGAARQDHARSGHRPGLDAIPRSCGTSAARGFRWSRPGRPPCG